MMRFFKKAWVIFFSKHPYKIKGFDHTYTAAPGQSIDKAENLSTILYYEQGDILLYNNPVKTYESPILSRYINNKSRFVYTGVFKEPDRYIYSIQNGSVIGLEDEKGTNSLIRTAGKNRQQIGSGPILFKTCKPQQDKSLDFPTVGLSTARECYAAGFSGIVLQANETILLDRQEVIEFCDAHNMFLLGKAA